MKSLGAGRSEEEKGGALTTTGKATTAEENKKTNELVKENTEKGNKQANENTKEIVGSKAAQQAEDKLPRHETYEGQVEPPKTNSELVEQPTTNSDFDKNIKNEIDGNLGAGATEELKNQNQDGGSLENPNPGTVKAAFEYFYNQGLVDDKGRVDLSKAYGTGDKASLIATVASIFAAIATGGNIPPINFYKLTGSEENVKARRENLKKLQNDLNDIYTNITGVKAQKDLSKDEAKYAGDIKNLATGEIQKMEKELDIYLSKAANDLEKQKNLVDFMAKVEAKKIPYAVEAMKKAGLSEDDIREFVRANQGQLSSAWQKALGITEMGATAVGAAAKALPF